jgi:TolA-binding protein
MAATALKWMLAIAIVATLLGSQPACTCGPFFEQAIFTYTLHPDLPLASYAQGQLGILQPTYAQSYLYVAYRYLSGMGFQQEEKEALLALWNERLNPQADLWNPNASAAVKAWSEVRAQIAAAGPPPQVNVFKALQARNGAFYYHEYVNCPADAFLTATNTLTERIGQFGPESVAVQDWVRAQDQVFSNCSGARAIPAPAAPQSPEILHKDRAYQIAAAHFYAADLAVAERLFRDIADDPASHWRPLALYLVARTLLRQGSLVPRYGEVDRAKLTEAKQTLNAILGDKNLQTIHPAASRLLAVVRARLEPAERLYELAQGLLRPNIGPTLKQDLWDYTLLLDRVTDERNGTGTSAARRDDVTDWILTFQDTSPNALQHALERWTATAALPWLVASLAKISAGHPRIPDLLAAAEKVPPEAPAFASVAFHRLRLLAALGRREEARQQLDSLLSQGRSAFPPSGRNLLLALRMKLARTLYEFMTYAPRLPAAITYNSDGRELPEDPASSERVQLIAHEQPLFDADSARVFNRRLPLDTLREMVHRTVLPTHLRRELAMAVLTRSLILKEEDTTRDLVPVVKALSPELGPWLDEYRATLSRDARAFTGVLMILRFPGLKPYVQDNVGRLTPLDQIDNYRDNWWCALEPATLGTSREGDRLWAPLEVLYRRPEDHAFEFLSAAQAHAVQQELQRLASLGPAPNYFSQQVVAWAQRAGNDPRVPEALHLAVQSTRFGCTDADTGALSKAAFDLLHQRYPKSSWAQKTKYWYK